MNKFSTLLAATAAAMCSPAIAADWHLAETEHFRVYSDDTADATKAYASELERLNEALALISGNFGQAEESLPDSAKVTVYRFGETSDIATFAGAPGSGIAGFFIPRAGASVAFVPRRSDNPRGLGAKRSVFALNPRAVLYHEYTHYFMFQHGAAAYPFWYIEGFAELFGTLQINPNYFLLGEVPKHRGYELSEFRIDLKSMLNPPKKRTGMDRARGYAIGWLLTSHLSFDPSRKGQLGKYLRLYNSGITPLQAAEQAFGDLGVLEKELDNYRRSPARMLKVPFAKAEMPAVAVRSLGADEMARMTLMMQSQRGVTEEQAKKQVAKARELVAQFPSSVPVLNAGVEVEFDAGNLDQAEALAKQAQKLDPMNLEAAVFRGRIAMKRAKTDPAQYAVARKLFIAANKIETDNPVPLAGYYLSFALAGETPPEDALAALEGAFSHAPFDEGVRRILAHMLLNQNRDEDATIVLGPLLNSAHTKQGGKLRDAFAKFKEGNRQPLIDELAPKATDDKPDKDKKDDGDDKDDSDDDG